jgi:ferredoxin
VKACDVAGAIDFARAPVRDRSVRPGARPARSAALRLQHAPPQGYFHLPGGVWRGRGAATLLKLRELVGEFEKPKFFDLQAEAVRAQPQRAGRLQRLRRDLFGPGDPSDKSRQQIVVNPNLCVGCGACTTVCPTGALGYTYPRARRAGPEAAHAAHHLCRAGGRDATLLLHSQERGQALVEELGAQARCGKARKACRPTSFRWPVAHRQHRPRPVAVRHRLRRFAGRGAGHRARKRRSTWRPEEADGESRRPS